MGASADASHQGCDRLGPNGPGDGNFFFFFAVAATSFQRSGKHACLSSRAARRCYVGIGNDELFYSGFGLQQSGSDGFYHYVIYLILVNLTFSLIFFYSQLAVLSRVFVHLPNRGGASTLWALGSMGFKWKRDFTRSCYSLPQPEGKLAQPLQKSVDKYLYQRVAAMHEQDYGVTLYSLGYLLGMERYGNGSIIEEKSGHTLRKVVWDKVDKRLERLAKFFSSRSLSQALKGFSRTGVHWADLSTQTRSAWEASLLAHINDSTGARARGLAGMHRMQLAETIFSLGMLRCRWVEMSPALQSEIRKCLDRDFIVYKQSITSIESAQASTVHTAAAEFDFYPEVEAASGVPIVFHETLLAYYAVEGLLRIEYPANDFPVALVDYSESHVKTTQLQEKAPQQLSKERKANYETFKRCLYYCRGLRATLQHNGSLI